MKEKYLGAISMLIAGVTGLVGTMVASGAVSAAAVTTGIVSLIMLVLEILRVQWITRDTVYGLVWSKIRCCQTDCVVGCIGGQSGSYSQV